MGAGRTEEAIMTYRESEAVNISTLKAMAISPAHYLEAVANAKRATRAMSLGTVVHAAVLEPERFMRDAFVCQIKRATKAWELYEALKDSGGCTPAIYSGKVRNGKEWAAFEAAHPGEVIALAREWDQVAPTLEAAANGRLILTQEELDHASVMSAAVHAHPVAHRLLQDGIAEQPIYWADEATGIDCKGRPDYVTPGLLVDLKTTNSAQPRAFLRDMEAYKTHMQLAFYFDGLGGKREVHVIAVESAPPYDVVAYPVPMRVIREGRDEYRALLRKLARCIEADHWPGISEEPVEYTRPAYAYADTETIEEVAA
jgi:hypothetical protein